jgi:hypothetical protein
VLGGHILTFVNTRRFFEKKKRKYISDFQITGFGYFKTLEEGRTGGFNEENWQL